MLSTTRKTKGFKIDGMANVLRTGTACVGLMPWESPYVVLEFKGKQYRWHADSVPESVLSIPDNESVYLEAFAYNDNLRRVRLSRCMPGGVDKWLIYGMQPK